jgi:hypothetical protein
MKATTRLAACAILALAGCNMITGADDIVFVDGKPGANSPDGSTGGATSGSGAASGSGTAQGGSTPQPAMGPVDGVALNSVVIYQSVSRPIMDGGSPFQSNVPVIADRPALVRLFYTSDGGYNGQPITARLTIGSAPPIEQSEMLVGGGSTEGNPDSTINIQVPAELIQTGVGYRVDLLQPLEQTTGQNSGARYPTTDGELADLGAQQSGLLKVTLVPVQYNGDGSGRLPDTSAAQLKRYEDLFFAMYPIADIDLQVHATVGYGGDVYANGIGWDNLLNAIADLRENDNAAFNEYYYGIFEPASSFNNYCGGGCVTGLGFVGDPQDGWSHSAIGVGFTGDNAAETAVHELGHNHGRQHAPCGTSGDGNYPYSGAAIGVWGYDMVKGLLLDPSDHVDMMSYCNPKWISDYNFTHIFERIQFVNSASFYTPPALQNLSYERVLLHPGGGASFMNPITLKQPPLGEAIDVNVQTSTGTEQRTGRLFRYDHLEGGVLFIPPGNQALIQSLSAVIDGNPLQIQK